jgi:hypothetical protein
MDTVDFLGIGVQKGGTTWLFRQLSRHPQVAFPRRKELHYWNACRAPNTEEWVRLLQPATRRTRDGRPVRTGEITPAYAILPEASIRAIGERCPEIRLFVSLRNPIERAWSAALMGLERCGMEVHEASDAWFLDHFRSAGSRQRGDYASCLERWWSVFPRHRLLLLFADDIATRPAAVLGSLAAHLAIDAADFAALPAEAVAEVVVPELGAGRAVSASAPLRPSLFGPLLELHAAGIERLERLVGRDLSAWRRAETSLPPSAPRICIPVGPGAVGPGALAAQRTVERENA